MNNDEYIRKFAGKDNPFKVPEGYFDNLALRVMSNLPAEDVSVRKEEVKRARRLTFPIKLLAAACVCAAIFGVAVYIANLSSDEGLHHAQSGTKAKVSRMVSSDVYLDEVVDYTMMDNTDIYTYLASE